MKIRCIRDIQQYDKLRPAWDDAFACDHHATTFVSWPWLRGWIETADRSWIVLAVRTDDTLADVAFLALTEDTGSRRLCMGGSPFSDHTGFVCVPGYEEKAIELFANYLQRQLQWDQFCMHDVFDPRLDLFLKHFSFKRFNIQQVTSTPCPYIRLPGTWDRYLQDSLSQKKRKSLKRCLREISNGNGFRLTQFPEDSQDPERQIEILLALWQAQWGRKPEKLLDTYRTTLRRCADSNSLWLATLWHKKNPVAATAGFVDRQKGVFYDYIGGWDSKFSYLSPGKTINAYSIRYAIDNRFHTYDFLRGAEHYKYSSFGAIDRFNRNMTIQRRSFKLVVKKMRKPLSCLKGISKKLITHRIRQKLCCD